MNKPKLISFDAVWNGHPDIADSEHNPCQDEGGEPAFGNECAIRMGIALKRAGVDVPKKPKGHPRLIHCWIKGHGEEQHILRAETLAKWMLKQRKLIGKVEKSKGTDWDEEKGVTWEHFKDRKGVVFFKDFWTRTRKDGTKQSQKNMSGDHIDVWNGSEQGGAAAGNSNDYFTRSKQIWFWELPEDNPAPPTASPDLQVQVGDGPEPVPDYAGVTLTDTVSAVAIDRVSLGAILARGLRPAPAHVLVVSGPPGAEPLTLTTLFEASEEIELGIPMEPKADGEGTEARLAFVWGGALDGATIEGVTVIAVGDEQDPATCAHSVKVASGGGTETTVDLRPLGSLRIRLEDPDSTVTETLRLTSSNGDTHEITPTEIEGELLEAIFETLDTNASYSLEINSGEGSEFHAVFSDVSYATIQGEEDVQWGDDDDDAGDSGALAPDAEHVDDGLDDEEQEFRDGPDEDEEEDDPTPWSVVGRFLSDLLE